MAHRSGLRGLAGPGGLPGLHELQEIERDPTQRELFLGLAEGGPIGSREARAVRRAGPLIGALRGFRGLQLPGVQRREFSTFAQRGFGLSGAARRGVRQRTAIFQAKTKSQEQEVLRQALADVIQEMQLEREIGRT